MSLPEPKDPAPTCAVCKKEIHSKCHTLGHPSGETFYYHMPECFPRSKRVCGTCGGGMPRTEREEIATPDDRCDSCLP